MQKLMGTTKIELTDVNTGEVEVYENHNMVTNALRDIFKPLGLSNRPNRYFSDFVPYYQTLLGGILCFDTEITEDPDNYYPPANANLIGCAAYGVQNNTVNTCRGGYNQTESEINLKDRYVKYVYDFATSQANGTIASVCLTHKNGGFTGYGYKNAVYNTSYPLLQAICEDTLQYVHPDYTGAKTSSAYSGMTVGTSEMAFLVDRDEDCMLYFKIVDTTHIHITKRRTFLKSVSILDNPRTTKPLIGTIELDELATALSTSYMAYNYDQETDSLYICSSPSSYVEANGTILVTQIKIGTWEIAQYSVTNTSNVRVRTDGWWCAFVTDGFLYLKAYNSPYNVYKFELSNSANVAMLTRINASTVSGYPKFAINGRIYYESYDDQLLIANTHTNEIMPPEAKSFFNANYNIHTIPVRQEPLIYFCNYGTWSTMGWYMMCNYLATINNLDVPVTKTADKTMKITYILQEQ